MKSVKLSAIVPSHYLKINNCYGLPNLRVEPLYLDQVTCVFEKEVEKVLAVNEQIETLQASVAFTSKALPQT